MPSGTDAPLRPVQRHAGIEAMTAELAGRMAAVLEAAIRARGSALLAVSGGSTPAPLYRALSQLDIDWARVTVLLVDERWVEPVEAGSNEGFVRETLLTGKAADARFIGLKTPDPSPFDAVSGLAGQVQDAGRIDLAVLGMGNDGHTASWFPHARGLEAALSAEGPPVAAIEARPSAVTGDHLLRMTLTRAALKQARYLLLMIRGEDKLAALEAARAPGPVEDMPVRALLRDAALSLDIHWTD